jgi:S1-C subfamily serine protease
MLTEDVAMTNLQVSKLFVFLLAMVVVAASCGSDSAELTASRDEVVVLRAAALSTPAEVFAAVSPSVVFVEVPDNSGSGVLLSSGYVVTNAHIVGHFSTVRLVTSAGELAEVPVYAKDWSTDLAVIGPLPFDELDGEISAVDLGSSATVNIGDAVYLIGYPGEVESHPVPAMTSGILSRRRLAPCLGMTFLQTDAVIAGGQSGGVLVDASGQVIGISGLGAFADSNFALVLTAEDVAAALEGLDEGSGSLVTVEGPGALKQTTEVAIYDSAGYLVTITEDQPSLSVTAKSPDGEDVWLDISTWDGYDPLWHHSQDEVDYIYESDEHETDLFYADAFDDETGESLEVSLKPGMYVVSTGTYSGKTTTIVVEASSPLKLLEDAEPSRERLAIGESVTGLLSHFEDLDSYRIDLQKGDAVRIQAASLADPVMSLYLDDELVASSDDAGIGLYGDGAEIVFEAQVTGEYVLEVMEFRGEFKAYFLSVDHADTGNLSC